MDRRTCLRSLGVAGIAGVAGCLEAVPGVGAQRADGAVLTQPDNPFNEAMAHPIYGEEVPSFSLPNLEGEEISPAQFEGDRAFFMTFIYTMCNDDACPALLRQLQYVQQAAREEGFDDDVAYLTVTFDPERDTPDRLREFGDTYRADHEADNWHFLRPESYEAATEIVNDQFGVGIDRIEMDDMEDDDHEGHDHEYHFSHSNLILLVNQNGIVERAYPTRDTIENREKFLDDPQVLADDLEAVVEGS